MAALCELSRGAAPEAVEKRYMPHAWYRDASTCVPPGNPSTTAQCVHGGGSGSTVMAFADWVARVLGPFLLTLGLHARLQVSVVDGDSYSEAAPNNFTRVRELLRNDEVRLA